MVTSRFNCRVFVVLCHREWSSGRSGPRLSSLGGESGGVVEGVAEHPGDHRRGCLEDELPERRRAAGERADAVSAEAEFDRVGGHGLAATPAREQPACLGVGSGGEVEPLLDVLLQQSSEGIWDRCGWFAEPDADLTVSSTVKRRMRVSGCA